MPKKKEEEISSLSRILENPEFDDSEKIERIRELLFTEVTKRVKVTCEFQCPFKYTNDQISELFLNKIIKFQETLPEGVEPECEITVESKNNILI